VDKELLLVKLVDSFFALNFGIENPTLQGFNLNPEFPAAGSELERLDPPA
jgi:hypothetical protein